MEGHLQHAPHDAAGIPFMGRWHYSRAELIADGVVHAVGIVLAIAAGSSMLTLAAFHAAPGEYVAAVFYVAALLTVLSVSLAYNLWPVGSPAKWVLRRFDHSGIYLLIAATYTPFLAQLDGEPLEGLDEAAAGRLGIAIVHQEGSLVPQLSIAENIFLGNEVAKGGVINWAEATRRTSELLAKVGGRVADAVLTWFDDRDSREQLLGAARTGAAT